MAKRFVTEFVINGDASGGVRAFNDTRNSADQLNSSMQTGTQRSAEYTRSIGSASAELQVLRRVAAPLTGLIAGMFTANALKSSIDFADQVQKINLRIGASTEFLSEMNYVAELSGVRFSELSTALQRQTRRMAEAAQGGGPMVKTLQQLNLSAAELSQLSPEDQFERIAQALNGVANEGDRVAMAQKIWDSEGVKLLQIVNQGTAAIEMQREQARALGLTISNETANAMAGFNDQMTVMTFAAQGLAQTLLAEIVPGMTTTLQATNSLIQELGGAERVVETVIDGSLLLSAVLAGRVVSALGASAVATGKKIAADRTAAAQAAAVAQQEASTALAVARRAEAEQVAALNSARISAQRAQAAQAEAAAKLGEVQANQQIMASERALEAQRLKAQISATGRQQSLNRLAEIRRTEMGLVAQSTAAQSALQAAEVKTAASTRALTAAKLDAAKAAGVSNAALAANTAAANTATTAHTALAGAARLGRMAMAPLGGPLGVAAAAATAFYLFRDSSDDVGVALHELQSPLDETIEKFQQLNRDQQEAELIRWGSRVAEEADKASEAFGRLRRDVIDEAFFNLSFSERFEFVDQLNAGFEEVKNGARSFDSLLQEVLERVDVDDQKIGSWRQLAGAVADHTQNVDVASERISALEAVLGEVADAADNAGDSVNNGAPSNETLDAWAKYNDRLRESIAAARDGGSALGAANRAMDGMGDDVTDVMRGVTAFLTIQDEVLKDQRKAQAETVRAGQQAATEAERNAQRQAQAAERAAEAQAKALAGVQQEMEPLLKDHATYIERLGVLDKALADNTISEEAYGEAVRWNAEQYARAATGAEDYEKQTESLVSTYDRHNQRARQLRDALEQINQRYRAGEIDGDQYARMVAGVRDEMQQLALEADPISKELARSWEEAANRINETFGDAFTGAYDSFEDFGKDLMSGVKRLIGEITYQATLQPIVIGVTTQVRGALGIPGAGGGQPGGGGGGGFNLSPGGIGNAWSAVQGGFGGIQWAGASNASMASTAGGNLLPAGSALNPTAVGSAMQVGGAAPTTGLMGGSAQNFSGATGLASAGAGFAGSYAGTQVGESMFGREAGSSYGATAGALAGTYIGGPIGAFIGGSIGGAIDAAFGRNKKTFDFDFAQGEGGEFGGRISEFGISGVTSFSDYKAGEQQDELNAMLDGMRDFDNALAATAIPARFEQMKRSIEGFRHSGPEDLFETRLRAIIDGSGALAEQAIASIADPEQLATAFQGVLQLEALGEQLGSEMTAGIEQSIAASVGGDVAAAVANMQRAADAALLLQSGVERLGIQFNTAAEGAIHAAGNIAEYVGGLDNLNALQSSYYQQYFSDAERAAHLQADLTAEFARYGAQLPETREEFRRMVEAQNLNTEAGQRNYAALLSVAGAFDQLQQSATGADSVVSDVISDTMGGVRSAWDDLNASIDAERQILDAAYRDTTASIRSNMQTVQNAMRQVESASRSLNNALRQTQSGTMFAREQGQATLQRMLAAGEITNQQELDNALQAVAEPSEQLFGSFLDYQRDFVTTAHDIYDLSQIADSQLSTEEKSLRALERQMETVEIQHSREMAQFDQLLVDQAAIIEAEFGTQDWLSQVNQSVLSVENAIGALAGSISVAAPAGSSSGDSGGGGRGSINTSEIAANTAGGWDEKDRAIGEAAIAAGLSSDDVARQIGKSPEYVRERAKELGLPQFRYGGIASGPESGHLAELHGKEAIVPLPNGRSIPVELRGPAAMPVPSLPPMPLFNQQRSADDMTVLIKRIETLNEQSKTQGGMQREALKALKALVRQLERWDDQDRLRVAVEKTVEPNA